MYTASGGEGDCTLRDLHAAAVLLNRAVLEPTCHDNVMLSPWRCILIVLVSACWVHAAPDDRRVKSQSLQFNLCRAFNTEQFVCDKILGHFCSFCVDPDAPEGSADKSICDTKSDVKRRERDGYKCHKNPTPPPTPSNSSCAFASELTCDADSQCTWCRSAAVGAGCFKVDQAKRLPPSIFNCSKNLTRRTGYA